MKAYIVTGTTRGIGRSLVEAIHEKGHYLFTLSSAAGQSGRRRQNLQCDLSRSDEVVGAMQRLLDPVAALAPDELVLINNAGVLAPMGPLETAAVDQIIRHLHVNQAAPAILMSRFIHLTAALTKKRRIINISSGAAHHPYAGWALYCASKAALDMMTRCAAAEQENQPNPVCISALYPGKVDTDMQRRIRQFDPAHFPAHESFVQAKMQGDLLSPGSVARLIVALDDQGRLKNGGVYDLSSAAIDADGRVTGLTAI